jgi:hypothetical protein
LNILSTIRRTLHDHLQKQNRPDGCFHAELCEPEYLLVQFWKVVARCLLFWWSNGWGEQNNDLLFPELKAIFNFTLTPFNSFNSD